MNNKEFYKDIMSNVQPSKQSVERIFDMTLDKKANKGLTFRRLASAALALAILIGSGFGINSLNNSKSQYVSPAGYNLGGIMTVEAKSQLGSTNADGKYDWGYRIYTKNIEGLSAEEIEKEKVEMAKLWLCSSDSLMLNEETFDDFTLNDSIKNNVHINNNVVYATERGTVEQALTICGIDDPSTVKEIRINNSSKYATPIIEANDLYYRKNANGDYIFDNVGVNTDLTSIKGHNITLSGDRYLKCRQIEAPQVKAYGKESLDKKSPFYGMELATGKEFYIDYDFTDDFYNMLGNNPNYELTEFNDDINISIEFNDGKIAENIINVSMDKNGKTYCQLSSYTIE